MEPAVPPIDPRPAAPRSSRGLARALLFAALVSLIAATGSGTRGLVFVDESGTERTLGLEALRVACGDEDVTVADPYHGRAMRYRALPLRCVLDRGFAASGGAAALEGEGMLLRALDGYARPVSGRTLLEPGGYVAFGETARLDGTGEGPPFSPIDRRQIDPAPFYMVWSGTEQGDPHDTPWPYQLARIEVAPFEQAFPATVPTGLPEDDPGWAGYRLFQRACASCHAINGQGGRVGPDLNVPRSIVEYRPIAQIKAYVRNPLSFRYTSMPPHPDLGEDDLDALVAYFVAMRARKQDPRSRAGSSHGTDD